MSAELRRRLGALERELGLARPPAISDRTLMDVLRDGVVTRDHVAALYERIEWPLWGSVMCYAAGTRLRRVQGEERRVHSGDPVAQAGLLLSFDADEPLPDGIDFSDGPLAWEPPREIRRSSRIRAFGIRIALVQKLLGWHGVAVLRREVRAFLGGEVGLPRLSDAEAARMRRLASGLDAHFHPPLLMWTNEEGTVLWASKDDPRRGGEVLVEQEEANDDDGGDAKSH